MLDGRETALLHFTNSKVVSFLKKFKYVTATSTLYKKITKSKLTLVVLAIIPTAHSFVRNSGVSGNAAKLSTSTHKTTACLLLKTLICGVT